MHTTVTLAAGWIETGKFLGADARDLIFHYAIPALCGLFVVVVGWRTKAPGPTIVAVILGAIVWGGALNMDGLAKKTGEDITRYDRQTSVSGGDQ